MSSSWVGMTGTGSPQSLLVAVACTFSLEGPSRSGHSVQKDSEYVRAICVRSKLSQSEVSQDLDLHDVVGNALFEDSWGSSRYDLEINDMVSFG